MKVDERIAFFIDGANMFRAQQKVGWRIDFKRFLDYFVRDKELYNAFYYSGVKVPIDVADDKFLTALTLIGYTVRTKPIKEIFDSETGSKFYKANLDIEIAIDMFSTLNNYDTAILCSGDGDFVRAVELLRSKGKRIFVVSAFGMIALELSNASDRFFELNQIRQFVERV